MSSFAHVEVAPPDALFNLSALYKQDPYPDKVDLGIGGASSHTYTRRCKLQRARTFSLGP